MISPSSLTSTGLVKPNFPDALGNLPDLLPRMSAGIARIRAKARYRHGVDVSGHAARFDFAPFGSAGEWRTLGGWRRLPACPAASPARRWQADLIRVRRNKVRRCSHG